MNLTLSDTYDVLIVGSGIAGLSAAREAGAAGCRTAILSNTRLFSGSSFYPGTWGFGLVGPEDDNDIEDLTATIERIGCGMADPALVRAFVTGINPAIAHLEDMGCHPKKAEKSSEREYIPCFDHKHRNWNGLETGPVRETFSRELAACQVEILNGCTLLEIVKKGDRVCGAVVSHDGEIRLLGCRALILATGGFGSLFQNHLCTDDVCGMGQYLALKAGCRLVNMEFMQMMPGYLYPARNTIFNEKTFRFAAFRGPDGTPLFTDDEEALLDMRSGYGPFTSRLPSRRIDEKLYQASLASADGVSVSYADAAKSDPPEFIKIYFDWLESEKHVGVEDTIHIGIFSHAANGGIRIDADGRTGVDGLFACGEVTGGMHGADRLGGLSTANGLVFGQRAGRAAAAFVFEDSDAANLARAASSAGGGSGAASPTGAASSAGSGSGAASPAEAASSAGGGSGAASPVGATSSTGGGSGAARPASPAFPAGGGSGAASPAKAASSAGGGSGAETCSSPASAAFDAYEISDRAAIRSRLQDLMYRNAMVVRTENGLAATKAELANLLANADRHPIAADSGANVSAITDSRVLEGQLVTALCLLEAALLRKESRGSHCRADFPTENPDMTSPIEITLSGNMPIARFTAKSDRP